ncbi:hypothetical protein CRI94_03945 [Longibacter salinarum]|uniref:Uncharacterized protein n=1 Tax=Longibacter salinarum TaxID=1850348 RepID=A0A2A8D020_9BACT|nr:hypothetical protein [Longibacter salinarum]PEN14201.1 hypothetical protein CRI94_03945 [Longibacter salinarum]
MDTILRIALTPDATAKATPLELLEDFADATPGWHYLESESQHYAAEKGVEACVLRHQRGGQPRYVDLAFAATDPDKPYNLELVLVNAPDAENHLAPNDRQQIGRTFLTAMRNYLDARPGHATLDVEQEQE